MFTPPPLPPWEGAHTVIVHFPIALLLVAPLFVLLGLLPRVGRGLGLAALVLLALGTTAAYVAVEAGEDAAKLVVRSPDMEPVLERHEELGEKIPLVYTVLTAVYAMILLVPGLLKKLGALKKDLPRVVPVVAQIGVWIALLITSLVLANVGHLGGQLVHRFGVQAWIGGS